MKSKQLFMEERERTTNHAKDAEYLSSHERELPPSNVHPLFHTMILSFGDVNRRVYVRSKQK